MASVESQGVWLAARLEDLGVSPVRITIAGKPAPAGPFTPDASGRVTAYIADMPYTGTLSLKTRSIWWGAALHISIAITMDVCALGHTRWW